LAPLVHGNFLPSEKGGPGQLTFQRLMEKQREKQEAKGNKN
jgi:hypothetical protein